MLCGSTPIPARESEPAQTSELTPACFAAARGLAEAGQRSGRRAEMEVGGFRLPLSLSRSPPVAPLAADRRPGETADRPLHLGLPGRKVRPCRGSVCLSSAACCSCSNYNAGLLGQRRAALRSSLGSSRAPAIRCAPTGDLQGGLSSGPTRVEPEQDGAERPGTPSLAPEFAAACARRLWRSSYPTARPLHSRAGAHPRARRSTRLLFIHIHREGAQANARRKDPPPRVNPEVEQPSHSRSPAAGQPSRSEGGARRP